MALLDSRKLNIVFTKLQGRHDSLVERSFPNTQVGGLIPGNCDHVEVSMSKILNPLLLLDAASSEGKCGKSVKALIPEVGKGRTSTVTAHLQSYNLQVSNDRTSQNPRNRLSSANRMI